MAVCKDRAWKNLTELSFERVTGTPDEKRAAELIMAQCQKAGVEAHTESYEIDMPVITEAKFCITEPEYKEFVCIALGKSGVTPDEGIEAPFVYIENATDVNMADVSGKICLVQGRTPPDFAKKLSDKGALGYIAMRGSFYEHPDMKTELRPGNVFGKTDVNMPAVAIHIKDAEELVRSHPTKVKMIVKQEPQAKGQSQNVVATIEGTDPELKKEVLVFTAHYDSVRYSSGAWDNATGSITIMELMFHYAENKPKRTVKFVWCGSEEIGLVGSRAYCNDHKDEMKDIIFNINFDMTGVTLGYEYLCCSANEETLHAIEYVAKLEGYPLTSKMDLYASDSTSFANAGVPSCSFARLNPTGGATIHNRHDTMEHLDPDSFMITLNFVVTLS
jgi:Iap family predicted aminopeptidase